ncbi:hypothetical protein AVEN_271402-1 [Araneus ventricosus]|uniref:Uncharacterized protein n=1 Tax=Araneus ventricosus TaxID=182803 RepID=A0A4Y2IYI0_ARAVE|nr:hypothetical protein AVEN_271402-1 [Araneus ventricosus]
MTIPPLPFGSVQDNGNSSPANNTRSPSTPPPTPNGGKIRQPNKTQKANTKLTRNHSSRRHRNQSQKLDLPPIQLPPNKPNFSRRRWSLLTRQHQQSPNLYRRIQNRGRSGSSLLRILKQPRNLSPDHKTQHLQHGLPSKNNSLKRSNTTRHSQPRARISDLQHRQQS